MGAPTAAGSRDGWWWLRVLVGVLLLSAVGVYVTRHWDQVVRDLAFEPAWLGVVLAVELALAGVRAVTLRETCRPFGVQLGRREALGLVAWATLANYLATAAGGMGVRAAYLKRRHGLDLAGFLSLISALYALQFMLLAIAGLVAVSWAAHLEPAAVLPLQLFFGALAVACAIPFLWPFPPPRGEGPLARTLRRVVAGWALMAGGPARRLLVWLLLYVALGWIAALAYFRLFGRALGAPEGLLISSLSEVSVLAAVAPAGLGVLESALAFGARLTGAPLAVGLGVAATRRLLGLLVTAALAALRPPWQGPPTAPPGDDR
jgi:uncharacterized membrane protein YbhN (UPF0104 family)